MQKALLITLFALSTISLKAQTNLDSLWSIWNDTGKADTTRLKAMLGIAWDGYVYSQPDSAFYFAQMAYDLAESKGLRKQMARAINVQGASCLMGGDATKALVYFQRGLSIFEQISNKNGIAASGSNIGRIYGSQGENQKALEYYQRSLNIFEEIGDTTGMATSLVNIGTIYTGLSDYTKGLDYFQQSLKISEKVADKEGIGSSVFNIGYIYEQLEEYSKASACYQRSLKIFEELGNKPAVAGLLMNFGNISDAQGDQSKALDYYQQSLKIDVEIGNKTGSVNTLNNIGFILFNQGDYVNSMDYYQRSLKLKEEIGDKSGMPVTLYNIGELLLKQGDHKGAIRFCEKGLQIALEVGNVVGQRDACKCLYDAYKSIGNGNKALQYHERMLVLTDSLDMDETSKKLQQMEFQEQMLADSLKQEGEKLRLKMVNDEKLRKESRARNMAIGAGILLLFVAIGFYSRARYIRRSRTALQIEKDRSDDLLLNILPAEIAEELKAKGRADARDFDMVSILFTDFKEFTQTSEKLTAKELVAEINTCFEAFDAICGKHGIEKIKTIGDAYMAAGGLPVPTADSVTNTVRAALEMQAFIMVRKVRMDAAALPAFDMRIGIHTGPVVAGIVGVKKFQYDIWGDTVNTASRMESAGEVGKVNISGSTYELVKEDPEFRFSSRGRMEVKGKGEMEMYFVDMNTDPLYGS